MIICGRESRSKVLMWPHAWREGSFVCFMFPGVPFRVSVADDRRMIGLTSYSRIDFSFTEYICINYRRTDRWYPYHQIYYQSSGFFCRESANRGRFRFDASDV